MLDTLLVVPCPLRGARGRLPPNRRFTIVAQVCSRFINLLLLEMALLLGMLSSKVRTRKVSYARVKKTAARVQAERLVPRNSCSKYVSIFVVVLNWLLHSRTFNQKSFSARSSSPPTSLSPLAGLVPH